MYTIYSNRDWFHGTAGECPADRLQNPWPELAGPRADSGQTLVELFCDVPKVQLFEAFENINRNLVNELHKADKYAKARTFGKGEWHYGVSSL